MTANNQQLFTQAFIAQLQEAIVDILHANKAGLSEYELISALEDYPTVSRLVERENGNTLRLFQIHFLVCHVLYRLQDEWQQARTAILEIGPLLIKKHAYEAGQAALTEVDKIREYYLNLDNLIETDERDVDELIASFWVQLNRFEHRDEALAVLGLTDPVDDETIRDTYRKLVMQHHPDRGGDTDTIQKINDAAYLLLKTK